MRVSQRSILPLSRVVALLLGAVLVAFGLMSTGSLAHAADEDLFESVDCGSSSAETKYKNTATATGTVGGVEIKASDSWEATFVGGDAQFCVGIQKFTQENGEKAPIDGASFELFADADGELGDRIRANADIGSIDGRAATYVITEIEPGTYWLAESKAPAGHTLLAEPIKFSVSEEGVLELLAPTDSVLVAAVDLDSETDGDDTIQITNLPAFKLPLVGSWSNALILVAVGLAILAVVALAAKRRRPAADA